MKRSNILYCFQALVVFGLISGGSVFAEGRHQAVANFVQAGEFYKKAEYSDAIKVYEKILKDGHESGEIYYNLANSYHRQGNAGRAFLNYERAAQLIPRDRDLKFNWNYLLGRYPDARPQQDGNILSWAIDRHLAFYTLDEMVVIVTILLVVFGGLGLAVFYRQWSRVNVINFCVVMLVLIGVFVAGLMLKIFDLKDKAVVLFKTSANFEPRADATEHFQLSEGALVKVLKSEDGWSKVRRWDKKIGWVPASAVETIQIKP